MVAAYKKSVADCIIAVGGGSPMDTSKAIGIIINNPEHEDVRSLEGAVTTKNTSVPIIAVPTTASTSAEVTINYVITDVEKNIEIFFLAKSAYADACRPGNPKDTSVEEITELFKSLI